MHQQEGAKGPLTLDDWRWSADQFNQVATKVEDAGMRFAYHNHYAEFGAIDGILPYDELLKHTDPAKVSFELDCGWVIVGGQDPVHYLKQYPTRIVMLHVKDFKDNKPPSVELGTGSVDYTPIFAAAAAGGHIRHAFVEQEEFQGPIMEALAVDAKYMKRLRRLNGKINGISFCTSNGCKIGSGSGPSSSAVSLKRLREKAPPCCCWIRLRRSIHWW